MGQQVKCPGCGRSQPMRGRDAIYYCEDCKCQFDDDPDEGGDYFADPAKRLDKQEARAARAAERKRKRYF
jgi:ribosomal protein L37AE/L43A